LARFLSASISFFIIPSIIFRCAASGIADLSKLLKHVADQNPLGRNVTIEEVGNAAAFLLSDLSSGITGEITYVDGGYSINALSEV